MAVKAVNKEETEQKEVKPIEAPTVGAVLNCKTFKLLKLEAKGDREFRVKFMADNFSGTADLDLSPLDDEAPMEIVFSNIGILAIAKTNPDQKKEKLTLTGLVRKDKNNKAKEPKTFFVFATKNTSGYGYTSKSKEIVQEDLSDEFIREFSQLELCVLDEIQRPPFQTSLLENAE